LFTAAFASIGTFLSLKVIGQLKNKRSRYGAELLFESKSNLSEEGVKFLIKLRLILILFFIGGLFTAYSYQHIG
jgi:hypothetical protein